VSHGVHAAPPSALRTLVTGIVDYAGLFPPASLDMRIAIENYATYRASADAWMLGRFVLPVSRLDEWRAAMALLDSDQTAAWRGARLSAMLSGEYASEAETIIAFNGAQPFGLHIDVAEGRTGSPDAVLAMAAAMPDDVMLYCEVPHRDDPETLLVSVRDAQVRAKIRTGGVTPEAFPTAEEIVRFLRRCIELGVTAKATAGLHHPWRGDYRLTYAPDAMVGTMFGYLNVFLCAAAMHDGASDAQALTLLLLDTPNAVRLSDGAVRVALAADVAGRDAIELSETVIAATRQSGIVAFGSCSFREPVDELHAMLALE
jgi:hypothetical protein